MPDLPAGRFRSVSVQPCFQKYLAFHLSQIAGLSRVIPFRSRGVSRSSCGRGNVVAREQACGRARADRHLCRARNIGFLSRVSGRSRDLSAAAALHYDGPREVESAIHWISAEPIWRAINSLEILECGGAGVGSRSICETGLISRTKLLPRRCSQLRSAAATFAGEFSAVTSSYGEGALSYAR
jgi:hypothetical protein